MIRAYRRLVLASLAAAPLLAQTAVAADAARLRFARRALELRDEAVRRGDQPYGAVVVKDGAIIAEGVSAVVTTGNPDAHAERVALRAAAVALGTEDLTGCELYGSSRPCSLCEAAAARAKIARMFYGPDATDGGVPGAILVRSVSGVRP